MLAADLERRRRERRQGRPRRAEDRALVPRLLADPDRVPAGVGVAMPLADVFRVLAEFNHLTGTGRVPWYRPRTSRHEDRHEDHRRPLFHRAAPRLAGHALAGPAPRAQQLAPVVLE